METGVAGGSMRTVILREKAWQVTDPGMSKAEATHF